MSIAIDIDPKTIVILTHEQYEQVCDYAGENDIGVRDAILELVHKDLIENQLREGSDKALETFGGI